MKSTILSLWFVSAALGDLLTATVKGLNEKVLKFERSGELLMYAALMLVVFAVFAVIAAKFKEAPPEQRG